MSYRSSSLAIQQAFSKPCKVDLISKDSSIGCLLYLYPSDMHMRGSRKFCQRESNLDNVFFLVDEGWEDPNTTVSGPSSARQRYAIQMAFHWHADDSSTLNAGSVAS